MNSSSPKTSIADYEIVLRISASGGKPQVVVGGQAVSIWAERYIKTEPELQKFLPFTSKDLDLLGDEADLNRLANATGYNKIKALNKTWIPTVGILEIPRAGHEPVKVEILKQLYGATEKEVRESALIIKIEALGISLHVTHPFILLKDKTSAAVHLPQDNPGEERQDVKHLKMMILCVRGFLREQIADCTNGKLADKDCLNLVQAAFQRAKSSDADQAKSIHGIDLLEGLPVDELRTSPNGRLRTFADQELRRWCLRNRRSIAGWPETF